MFETQGGRRAPRLDVVLVACAKHVGFARASPSDITRRGITKAKNQVNEAGLACRQTNFDVTGVKQTNLSSALGLVSERKVQELPGLEQTN